MALRAAARVETGPGDPSALGSNLMLFVRFVLWLVILAAAAYAVLILYDWWRGFV